MSEVFKKVAENNVRVFERTTVNGTDGVDHNVLTYIISYGQDGINDHLIKAQAELNQANTFDAEAYKAALIAKSEKAINNKTIALGLFETIEIPDENGVVFEILDPEDVKKYAEVGISAEAIEQHRAELTEAQLIDPVAFKQNLIDIAQAKITRLALIQAEMDS